MNQTTDPRLTRHDIERRLAYIWRESLGIPKCSRTDDFFAAGGDSVAATKLVIAIEQSFRVKLPMSALVENPTLGQLAGRIETAIRGNDPQEHDGAILIPVRRTGTRPPLFLVHGLMGHAVFAHILGKFLGEDQPLYAIRAKGFDGQKPADDVHEMAGAYLTHVRTVQPHGPYFIGGNCSGSFIALEMCRTLLAAGEKVGMMLAIDPLEPGVSFTQRQLGRPFTPGDEQSSAFRGNLRQRLEDEVYGRGAIGNDRMEWAINVAAALDAAIAKHTPAPYPCPVTIIASVDRLQAVFNPKKAWRNLSGKGTRVHAVSAPHLSLFLDKGELIAQLIRKTMDAALAER